MLRARMIKVMIDPFVPAFIDSQYYDPGGRASHVEYKSKRVSG